MYQEWMDTQGNKKRSLIAAPIMQLIELIGENEAASLLLHYGGAPAYFSCRPERNNTLLNVISLESMQKLAAFYGVGNKGGRCARVPCGNGFLVRYMRAKGVPIYEIARLLHRTDKWVRRELNSTAPGKLIPVPESVRQSGAARKSVVR